MIAEILMQMPAGRPRQKMVRGWITLAWQRRVTVWVVAIVWLSTPVAAWGDDVSASTRVFRPGERLTFVLKWTIIPAGEAVLEVLAQEHMAGIDAHHFVLTARSNSFVDAFYTVRDRIDAWSDVDMTRSLRYRKKQHEGSTRRDITVSFDWEAMTAQYANQGETREPISISEGTFDPLSIFYWFRLMGMTAGSRIRRSVTDGKKCILGMADVVRRERVRVPAGTFDTFLIEPDLTHVGGVFEKSPNAKIQLWVSADRWCLPVKLKSKVIVGSFSGELVSMTGTGFMPPVDPSGK